MFSQNLNFTNINADMGLPSNECYRIAQDKKGYIWVSTEVGLAKYNSKGFELFDKSKGMPGNNIYALDVDSLGRIWFATGDSYIGYIMDDKVIVLSGIDFYSDTRIVGDVIYKIKYNQINKSLLVSFHHQSVEIIENGGKYYSKEIDASKAPKDFKIIKNRSVFYTANLFYNARRYLKNNLPIHLHVDEKDSLLLPIKPTSSFFTETFTSTISDSFYILSILNKVIILSKKNKLINTITLPSQIQGVYGDSEGNLWVGCKKEGLFFYKKGQFGINPTRFLEGLSVNNIFEDDGKSIWVTSLEKGIYYSSNLNISILKTKYNSNEKINFCKVVNDKLWLNGETNPLVIIGGDTIIFHQLGEEKKPQITDVAFFKNEYYVSTSLGIYKIDYRLKKVTSLSILSNKKLGGFGFLKIKNESLFMFNNVFLYEIRTNKINYIELFNQYQKIKHAVILKSKKILFCNKNGLFTITKEASRKINPVLESNKFSIRKIYCDMYNNFWLMGIGDTLNILGENLKYKSKIVLKNKDISYKNILQVDSFVYFICTNKGLVLLTFSDTSFKIKKVDYFDAVNGLLSNDIFDIVFFDNNYYVSTSNGLCMFKNIESLKHHQPPNTIISAVNINDSLVRIEKNKSFSYKQNNVTFQVDALTYKKITQKGFFFKYKLEGFDENFKLASSNIITYNNLPPGNYKFIAKAFYDNDTEDQTPAELSFTIKPAFWQTWWGLLFLFCLGAFVVLLFIQWRIKKVKKQEAEKNEINKTIAEYRFTALKAQMNPHFVFNSINVIQNLILEKDKTEAYNSLGKFSRLIRSILNQSDSVYATIEEEITLIDLFVELNQLRVQHSFTFKKEIQPETLVYSIPSLIIQPFIENAIWHGILSYKGEKKGEIILRIFSNLKNVLTIEIQDNGVGRKATEIKKSASSIYKSKGINLIKERLNAYKAINKNCLAELDIIDLEENGTPLGTLVKLKISVADEKE